jgi:hypothetical protein
VGSWRPSRCHVSTHPWTRISRRAIDRLKKHYRPDAVVSLPNNIRQEYVDRSICRSSTRGPVVYHSLQGPRDGGTGGAIREGRRHRQMLLHFLVSTPIFVHKNEVRYMARLDKSRSPMSQRTPTQCRTGGETHSFETRKYSWQW